MAISKERLKELVEKDKIIYFVDWEIRQIQLNDNYIISYNEDLLVEKYTGNIWDTNDLFEVKEEAQEYLEFGNVIRTQELKLPNWKEIEKEKGVYDVEFLSDDGDNCDLIINKAENKILVLGIGGAYDTWNLTKENYDEARRLCVKLFKGESV